MKEKMTDKDGNASVSERMNEIIARNPFAAYIGMELLECKKGYARARIRLSPRLQNIYGGMHGGCVFSLADTVAGVAAASYGNKVTTLDASINFMRPVTGTEYLYCEAKVKRSGTNISVVCAEMTGGDGKLLADASFTYYHM